MHICIYIYNIYIMHICIYIDVCIRHIFNHILGHSFCKHISCKNLSCFTNSITSWRPTIRGRCLVISHHHLKPLEAWRILEHFHTLSIFKHYCICSRIGYPKGMFFILVCIVMFPDWNWHEIGFKLHVRTKHYPHYQCSTHVVAMYTELTPHDSWFNANFSTMF